MWTWKIEKEKELAFMVNYYDSSKLRESKVGVNTNLGREFPLIVITIAAVLL